MRLAELVRPPWLPSAGVLAAMVAAVTLRSAPPPLPSAIELHVKLKPCRELAHGAHGRPLFTHLPAAVHDGRERWVAIDAFATDGGATLLAALERDPAVEEAFVAPETGLPSLAAREMIDDSCPITTPSYEEYQGYLGPAPQGIDAPAAWRKGERGRGEWFADIEGGWNAEHEDLPGQRMKHVFGTPVRDASWRAHGTAVLGEVVGTDNGKGVVGIAPDVERIFTSSIGNASGKPMGSVADAIDAAAEELRPGDVLLIELQGSGPRNRYLPMEFWDDAFEAISAATKRGVVVIEAAGNGGENLDHKAYRGKFDRKNRDSGAIMVGAGGPPRPGFRDRERLGFSNYGARVDVQGWGRKVATLDYGDLQRCSGADRHYTNEFSGTSSASPIVAGAALLVEGYARTNGFTMTPAEVAQVLRDTGTPQTGDTSQHIGPRPDLARALAAIPPIGD
jgi:hypothetical protein